MTVNTNIIDLNDYLQHILKSTNMKCLTPEKVGLRRYAGHGEGRKLSFKDKTHMKPLNITSSHLKPHVIDSKDSLLSVIFHLSSS